MGIYTDILSATTLYGDGSGLTGIGGGVYESGNVLNIV